MPPRHGKSELVSRKLPAFIFGKNPDAQIIATSYGPDLAQQMNRDVQRIMESPAYEAVFPNVLLPAAGNRSNSVVGYRRNKSIFEIVGHGGSYRCAGVGGGITGMGGNYIIVDDPVKNREEANSATYRKKLWEWYTGVLYTRQEKDAGILVTLTRWHEDDLAGRILAAMNEPGGEQWEIISLPAIREDLDSPYDIRKLGEPLWEDKFNRKTLDTIKTAVGSYDWSALYQQRPSPGEGGIFKREWWQRWKVKPGDLFDYIQSWDCTFKDFDTSDYVVGQVWARSKKHPAQRYLLDQVRDRMTFTETVQAVRDMSAKWRQTTRKLIEDAANGAAVMDVLKREIPGIIAVKPLGGKVVRAHAISACAEAGNIFVPDSSIASWVYDFIEEMSSFPSGANDDQVDATTQANTYYNDQLGFNINTLIS